MHRVEIGQEIRLDDGNYVIAGMFGGKLKLRNLDDQDYCVLHVTELVRHLTDVPVATNGRAYEDYPMLDTISEKDHKHISQLATHLRELMDGTPPSTDMPPRPEYDPQRASLAQRINQKAEELRALGCPMSARTLRRKLDAFRDAGEAGLIDRRSTRRNEPLKKLDPRVQDTLISVMAAEQDASTGTRERLSLRLDEKLQQHYPGQGLKSPPRTTLWRYSTIL